MNYTDRVGWLFISITFLTRMKLHSEIFMKLLLRQPEQHAGAIFSFSIHVPFQRLDCRCHPVRMHGIVVLRDACLTIKIPQPDGMIHKGKTQAQRMTYRENLVPDIQFLIGFYVVRVSNERPYASLAFFSRSQ